MKGGPFSNLKVKIHTFCHVRFQRSMLQGQGGGDSSGYNSRLLQICLNKPWDWSNDDRNILHVTWKKFSQNLGKAFTSSHSLLGPWAPLGTCSEAASFGSKHLVLTCYQIASCWDSHKPLRGLMVLSRLNKWMCCTVTATVSATWLVPRRWGGVGWTEDI